MKATLTEWRWGSLVEAIDQILDVWAVLQFWDEEAYLANSSEGDPEDRKHGRNRLEVNTKAVRIPFFHVYAKLLRTIQDVLLSLQHWAESCPCHHHRHPSNDTTAAIRNAVIAKQFPVGLPPDEARCPMLTMRAPELAAGKIDEFLNQILSVAYAEVLLSAEPLATNELRVELLAEYGRAQTLVRAELTIKLGFAQSLPFSLCAVGLPEAQAREHLRAARAQYRSQPFVRHHPLTKVFFENALAAEVSRFVDDGEPLQNLPRLSLYSDLC